MNKIRGNRSGIGIIAVLATFAALDALAAITETVDGRAVTLSGDSNDRWTKRYLAEDVDNVAISSTGYVIMAPSLPSTYTGGTTSSAKPLYLESGDALGTGSLTLQGGALGVQNNPLLCVTVPNKVIFGQNNSSCYASTIGDSSRLILKSVGTPTDGATHHIRLGRPAADSVGSVTLSLTDENSEALDEIRLSGRLRLCLDGGVLKMRSDASSPFFTRALAGTEVETVVGFNGIGVEVPENREMTLGEPLVFTNGPRKVVREVYEPSNNSFESGATGWQLSNVSASEASGVKTNGGSFDGSGAFPTTNGSHYAMIRQSCTLKTTIRLPTAGNWRVVFERGCRDGSFSLGMRTWVKIDTTPVLELPALSTPLRFTEYRTDSLALEANHDYDLIFEVESGSTSRSFNFDAIRLERLEDVSTRVPFVKKGSGTLLMGMQTFNNSDVSVESGTFASCAEAIENVSVLNGGTYELSGTAPSQSSVISVAAGGTLALVGTPCNLLKNGSFEDQQTDDYTSGSPSCWTGERIDPDLKSYTANGFGIHKNSTDTTLAPNGPVSAFGRTTLFLKPLNQVSQTVSVLESGEYSVTFIEVSRQYYNGHKMPIIVKIDGEAACTIPPRAARVAEFTRHSFTLQLAQGNHVFAIASGDIDNATSDYILIDNVELTQLKPQVDGVLALQTGSTLRLGNIAPIRWLDVTVDGASFSGNRDALVNAGVTVEGSGRFRAGPVCGAILIYK